MEGKNVELNVKITGDTRGEIISKLMKYVLDLVKDNGANSDDPDVDPQWGGDGP
ncbi:MAG: hypothetical protein ABUK15_07295 [Anaerolineales bacterium]